MSRGGTIGIQLCIDGLEARHHLGVWKDDLYVMYNWNTIGDSVLLMCLGDGHSLILFHTVRVGPRRGIKISSYYIREVLCSESIRDGTNDNIPTSCGWKTARLQSTIGHWPFSKHRDTAMKGAVFRRRLHGASSPDPDASSKPTTSRSLDSPWPLC